MTLEEPPAPFCVLHHPMRRSPRVQRPFDRQPPVPAQARPVRITSRKPKAASSRARRDCRGFRVLHERRCGDRPTDVRSPVGPTMGQGTVRAPPAKQGDQGDLPQERLGPLSLQGRDTRHEKRQTRLHLRRDRADPRGPQLPGDQDELLRARTRPQGSRRASARITPARPWTEKLGRP